jgi:hypothetical protein
MRGGERQMYKTWIFAFVFATAAAGMMLLSSQASAGAHDDGYYSCNGKDNGVKYYRYVKKKSDSQETSFKQAVRAVAGSGGCSKVHKLDKEPSNGTAI